MHERKLIRIGNSIGVTFPPEVVTELGLDAGDWLELHVKGDWLMVNKSDLRARTEEHENDVSRHRRALETRARVKK